MSEDNPFDKLKFSDKPYKDALDKVNASFDSTITETATEAGMAAGQGGGNVATVGADAYVKAMSSRNQSEAQLLNAKAGAESNFNAERDFKSAEWKSNQAGPLDWITTGLGVAGTVASTIMTGGATVPALIAGGASLLGKFGKGNTNVTAPLGTTVDKNFTNQFEKSTGITEPGSSPILDPIKLKLKPKKDDFSWLKTSDNSSMAPSSIIPIR